MSMYCLNLGLMRRFRRLCRFGLSLRSSKGSQPARPIYCSNAPGSLSGPPNPTSYDHWIRAPQEFERVLAYTLNNPINAGLVTDWDAWRWHWLSEDLLV